MLSEARILLFAACVIQAQRAEIAVQLKRQNQDGSLDITVTCSLTNTEYVLMGGYGPCSIRSHSGKLSGPIVLASSGDWPTPSRPGGNKTCEHQLRLVDTRMALVTANKAEPGNSNAAVPTISSSNRELLDCTRGFVRCTDLFRCEASFKERDYGTTISSQLIASVIRKKYVRSAKINDNQGKALQIPHNGNLTLECEVENLEQLPAKRCQWWFVDNQNATRRFEGRQTDDVEAVAGLRHQKVNIRKDPEHPNVCLLELRAVDGGLEGRWSCNPSEGQDGFILPSSSVSIKVIDECKAHSECPEKQICLNATDKEPRRICSNPCDQKMGKDVCENLTNSVCKVDKNTFAGMVCACLPGYASDTGYLQNRTRCLHQCTTQRDCSASESICIRVGSGKSGRCLPVCEVTKPQCGSGSICETIPSPNQIDEPFWTSRCECEAGKFKNYLLPNSSFECELPIFDGLHMIIHGEHRQTCSTPVAQGTAHCQMIVTEGSLLNVTCEAPRVFPAAHLLELGIKSTNSSLVLESGNDGGNLTRRPLAGHPPMITTIENLQDKLGTRYHGVFSVMGVSVADHHNASFVCKLTLSAASGGTMGGTVVEMKVLVVPAAVGGASVAVVVGCTTAAGLVVIALVAVVVIAIKRQQPGQQEPGHISISAPNATNYNSVSYNQEQNSAGVAGNEEEPDNGEYEEITRPFQPTAVLRSHDPQANISNCYKRENTYF